jgi:hypothetical protein
MTRTAGRSAASDRRLAPPSALAIVIASIAFVVTLAFADAGGTALFVSYAVPSVVLAIRRPGQPIVWMLLLMALGLGFGTTKVTATVDELAAGSAGPVAAFTAWANGTGWCFVFAGLSGLALVFPRGSLPTGRWGIVAWLVIVAFVPIGLVLVLGPVVNVTIPGYPAGVDVPNPFAVPFLGPLADIPDYNGLLWPLQFVLTVVAMVSLLARFRGSTGLERLQYRWLAWAVVLVGVASVAWTLLTFVLQVEGSAIARAVVGISYSAIPVAIVIAVLRYRLYDIDRLVSRTLGWGFATATIVAVFVGAVLALQAALSGVTQSGTLAVAASTLLAFALFQPVRRRVQALVDRQFDRPRLEAERILAGHGERLRRETDLERIEVGVLDTVSETLRPASASVWIRHAGAHGP